MGFLGLGGVENNFLPYYPWAQAQILFTSKDEEAFLY